MFKRLKRLSKSFYLTFLRPRRIYHFKVVFRDSRRRVVTKHFRVCERTRKAAYALAAYNSYTKGIKHYKLVLTQVSCFECGQSMQTAR